MPPDPGATGTAAPPKGSPLGDFFDLQVEQGQLRRDQQAITQALDQMRGSSASVEGLGFIGAVQRSPELSDALREVTTKRAELRALRYRYTDDHPTVRRLAWRSTSWSIRRFRFSSGRS